MSSPPPKHSLSSPASGQISSPVLPTPSSSSSNQRPLEPKSRFRMDKLPSPSASGSISKERQTSTSLLPPPPQPTGSTPTKRRSKVPNNDRRNTDIEFATEIGQGLLLEVRKMQALLQEKEEMLRTLQIQKADLERAAEAMAKQLRQREENEERLKEETWNLELAKQELTISVTELQQNLTKANAEYTRVAKKVSSLSADIEALRDKEEKLSAAMETMKVRHEQDMSSARRQTAALQRDKQDQSKQIEALTSELAIAKAQSRMGKHSHSEGEPMSNVTGDEIETKDHSPSKDQNGNGASPPSSPKLAPSRNQALEVETLKTSLAHAHRMVSNLRSNYHKEKTEKFELKKLLAESQETIEQMQNDPRMWEDASSRLNSGRRHEDGVPPSPRRATAKKRRVLRRPRAIGRQSHIEGQGQAKGPSRSFLAGDDDTDAYSYSSMSSEETETESEAEPLRSPGLRTMAGMGFTSLSSELSQSQRRRPIVVDTGVMTEPVLITPVHSNDGMHDDIEDLVIDQVALQKSGTEIYTQTEHVIPKEYFVQTDSLVTEQASTQTNDTVAEEIAIQTDDVDAEEVHVQTDDIATQQALIQTDGIVTKQILVQTDGTTVEEALVQTENIIAVAKEDQGVQVSPVLPCLRDAEVQYEDGQQGGGFAILTELALTTPTHLVDDMHDTTKSLSTGEDDNQEPGSEMHTQTEHAITSEHFSQTEGIVTEQASTQTNGTIVGEIYVQTDGVNAEEVHVQTNFVAIEEALVQTDDVATDQVSIQTDSVATEQASIQTEGIVAEEIFVQTDSVKVEEIFVQTDNVKAEEIFIQTDNVKVEEIFVQTENTATEQASAQTDDIDAEETFVQTEAVEVKEVSVQTENTSTEEVHGTQVEPVAHIIQDAEVQYDRTENGKDFAIQYPESSTHLDDLPSPLSLESDHAQPSLTLGLTESNTLATGTPPARPVRAKERQMVDAVAHEKESEQELSGEELYRQYLAQKAATEVSATPVHEKGTFSTPMPERASSIKSAPGRETAAVPPRPDRPPPAELLSKAGKQSTSRLADMGSSVANRSQSADDTYGSVTVHSSDYMTGSVSSLSTVNTNDQRLSVSSSQFNPSVKSHQSNADPSTISVITKVMIGDWMYKYTRKAVGGAISENRHQRYFWIHPYTRTLYWSSNAPGVDGSESKAKSAFIESVSALPDTSHPDAPKSLLIQASGRQIKVTAPSMEQRNMWFESISYLVSRAGVADAPASAQTLGRKPSAQQIQDLLRAPPPHLAPSPQRTYSTPLGSFVAPKYPSRRHLPINVDDHDDEDDDDDEPPLEDVRMCCNGKHHVSKLEKEHTHKHHRRTFRSTKSRN